MKEVYGVIRWQGNDTKGNESNNYVILEMVKWIAPSFEAKEEIDSNFENFYTLIDSPSKPLSNVIKE